MLPGFSSSSSASTGSVPVQKTVFITTVGTSTYTIPADFISLVSIEVIAAGQKGDNASGVSNGGGNAGGCYAAITSLSGLTAGGSLYCRVGTPSSADTWVNKTSSTAPASTTDGVLAKTGTSTASCVGNVKFGGGAGSGGGTGTTGGGGGGAGGPNGAGLNGANGNSGGAGGAGNNGQAGGGAGGTSGSAGNAGTYWTATAGGTAGPGGGGAGGNGAVGGAGGSYGAGGGGGSKTGSTAGGAGAQGIIIFTYMGSS